MLQIYICANSQRFQRISLT